jgi:hypothetical protein
MTDSETKPFFVHHEREPKFNCIIRSTFKMKTAVVNYENWISSLKMVHHQTEFRIFMILLTDALEISVLGTIDKVILGLNSSVWILWSFWCLHMH